ncbi:MAG: hypothetical protein LQ344_001695 [Seirophora lacunosa]|nr:MAG: hypothetical protein LQ344_001695 [Seirophora lacunosa]
MEAKRGSLSNERAMYSTLPGSERASGRFFDSDHCPYDGDDPVHIASCARKLQQIAKDAGHEQPLMVGLREANGLYDGLPFELAGARFPYPLSLAAANSTTRTRLVGRAIGQHLGSIGINWVFTPTIDLLGESVEPLDASKTFGQDAESVCGHALALIQGLADGGVSACTVSHPAAPTLEILRTQSSTELASSIHEQADLPEFAPLGAVATRYPRNSMQFGAAIHEFQEPERSAHAIRATCDLVLRNMCGFQGPTVSSFAETTDDAAVCAKHTPLLSILSGLDMVKLPEEAAARHESISALEAAMASGAIPSNLIPAAAARVAAFKAQFLSWERALVDITAPTASPPAPGSLARAIYQDAVTALSPGTSPLHGLARTSILVVLTPTVPRRVPDSPSDPFEPLGRALSDHFSRLRHVPYTLSAGLTDVHRAFLQRAAAVVFVLCNTSSAMIESQDEFVRAVHHSLRARDAMPGQQRTRKVVIGAGNPRDLRDPFAGWWGVLCYEYSKGALEAVAKVVLGEREATGKIPST